ncbi:MAG: hypothetical protein QM703_17105 [Gemmatales bacterium]
MRSLILLVLVTLAGCSSKQQITMPTGTSKAPTGTFTMTEAGGGKLPGK